MYYLANEIWQEKDLETMKSWTDEEYLKEYHHENDFYINVIKFGAPPLSLENRVRQAPKVKIRRRFLLSFSNNHNFVIAKDSKVVEAYLHNNNKRCTVLFKGLGTFTF